MRIVMMGTGLFARPTFEALLDSSYSVVGLVTQPDRDVGQERGSTRQTGLTLKELAQQRGIPVFQPESINTPEGVEGLRAWQPDLLVVAAYGQILSADVLGVPLRGGINVHGSLLPRYRGAAPIAWAILKGEQQTGVTIIRMSVSLDAGDILARESLDILPHETAGELEARLAPLGARLTLSVIEQMQAGTLQGEKQDPSLITRAPKLKKKDGLIDWNRTAAEVCRHIRAMQPWPTAYTFWHRGTQAPVRLILSRAVEHREGTTTASPGQILPVDPHAAVLHVAAGDGSVVEVQELQPAGKRRMSAADFLHGHRPAQAPTETDPSMPPDRLGPMSP
jgi:methionyl-tRNA formyltransferase